MFKKVNQLKDEFKALYKDYNTYKELYGFILGALVYQFLSHLMLSYIPVSSLRMFTWLFWMLLFWVGLLILETPISFTQLYHISILWIVQILIAFEIRMNPIFQFFIFQILFRRVRQTIYENLSTESLLPYALKDLKSRNSSFEKVFVLYEAARLSIVMVLLMTYRHTFSPMFLSHFSAPWWFFKSEFPIFWVALWLYLYTFKNEKKDVALMIGILVCYWILFEPDNTLSIVWHFATATAVVIGIKAFPLLTIILSVYGGITFFAFGLFENISDCTTMYVFMTNCTFLGSLCICWLIYPPEILLYKPKYLHSVYYGVILQFFVMLISFFLELTVEHPVDRKSVYIEGVWFIFLWMLYFLIKFLWAYYFSYGIVYRHYLVKHISRQLKKQAKRAQDEAEIARAVGREVDNTLRDEIDTQVRFFYMVLVSLEVYF